jgi:hypothetical protein
MNKFKFWLIFAIIAAFIIVSTSTHINKSDIDTTYVSLNEQQKIVLKFENELVCNYHTLCFDSVVDGAMRENPARASQNCKVALQGIQTLNVPYELPEKVKKSFNKAKDILKNNVEGSLEDAKYANNETTEAPPVFKFSGSSDSSTCHAFAIIENINTAYGLREMMQGQYVNCAVINNYINKQEE